MHNVITCASVNTQMGENRYSVLLNLIDMTRYQAVIEVNAYKLE